jgi:type IV secretion/conjugal transfer VirB4 family ATPase
MIRRNTNRVRRGGAAVLNLNAISRQHREAGAMNTLVNLHAAIDDQVFLTKGGDVLTVLKADVIDAECLDAAQIDQRSRQYENNIRTLDDSFRIYQYVVKRHHPPIPQHDHENAIVREATANRRTHLEKRVDALYTVEVYFVIACENFAWNRGGATLVQSLRGMLSNESTNVALGEALDRSRDALMTKVNSFVIQLQDSVKLQVLPRQEAFRFLRRLVNFAPYKAEAVGLRHDDFIDFQLCDSSLECYADHLRLDNYFVKILTLKEPSPRTFAHMLKGLMDVPSQMIVATEWRRLSHAYVRRIIQSKRRHFHNSKASLLNYLNSSDGAPKDILIDSSATAILGELGSCLQAMEVEGHCVGEFSMMAVLYDEDRDRLQRTVAECFKVFGSVDAALIEERYNLLNAFLAVLPGNRAFNLRRLWLQDTNYADLSFLFKPHAGEIENKHLGREHLAVLETNQRTPFFFNLHVGDIAHALILGQTGSGKSFFLNFLLTHLQKYNPFTFIFDLAGGYEDLTRLFGGAYVPVGDGKRSFSINPFTLPLTPENQQFLMSFLRVLIESAGYEMAARDELDLHEQLQNLYAVEPAQRRLLTLANILNRGLREQLQSWVEGGPYGALFDNVEDNLTFARFQTFDFSGMDKTPRILEPLLFYILHRANAAIDAADLATTFKVFVVDEAWRFLQHPTIRGYIQAALKTWRKKNAAMLLATQSSDDLLRSEILSVVVESCPTKIFLANPDLDQQVYREIFHLNEREADTISKLTPKHQILLKTPEMAKVLNLNVDAKGYWLYTSNPFDNQKKRAAFERYGFEEGLEILARSNPS